MVRFPVSKEEENILERKRKVHIKVQRYTLVTRGTVVWMCPLKAGVGPMEVLEH